MRERAKVMRAGCQNPGLKRKDCQPTKRFVTFPNVNRLGDVINYCRGVVTAGYG